MAHPVYADLAQAPTLTAKSRSTPISVILHANVLYAYMELDIFCLRRIKQISI